MSGPKNASTTFMIQTYLFLHPPQHPNHHYAIPISVFFMYSI